MKDPRESGYDPFDPRSDREKAESSGWDEERAMRECQGERKPMTEKDKKVSQAGLDFFKRASETGVISVDDICNYFEDLEK